MDEDLAGHDQLWQELLEKFFPDFLTLTDPDLAEKLQLDQATFLREKGWAPPVSHESSRGRLLIHDLVARIPVRRPPPSSVVVNVEVEHAFRRKTESRLHRYHRRLALRHPGEPVLSIVLYLTGGPPGVVRAELREEFLGIDVSSFHYYAFGLARCRAEEWIVRPQPLAAAFAALMKSEIWSRPEHKIRCLQAVARANLDQERRFLLVNAIGTYLQLNSSETQLFDEMLAREERTEVREMAQTWAAQIHQQGLEEGIEQGIEQGIERGIEQGIERGIEQGARRLLVRQLKLRFGPLPAVTMDRLEAIHDLAELDRLAERLLRAESLDELGLA